jgi:PPOX class probable F420-dependent enzyme
MDPVGASTHPDQALQTTMQLVEFVRARGLGVVATVGPAGAPQAALVGLAATERGELVFDTARDSRKLSNIVADHEVALVVGWHDEVTAQIEGVADIPREADRDRCLDAYFQQYPEGRERAESPSIVHVRVRPRWVRYSDFRPATFGASEVTFEAAEPPGAGRTHSPSALS